MLNGSEGRADKRKDRDIREGFETEDPVRADLPGVREGSLGTLDDEGGPRVLVGGPEGSTTTVHKLDLRPGGEFEYAMTATRQELIEGMKAMGLPLTSVARGTYTEVTRPRRLAYTTLADFIPGVAPYEVAAFVEIQPLGRGVRMVVTEDAMHDELWTERSTMGMNSSLDRLAKGLEAR